MLKHTFLRIYQLSLVLATATVSYNMIRQLLERDSLNVCQQAGFVTKNGVAIWT